MKIKNFRLIAITILGILFALSIIYSNNIIDGKGRDGKVKEIQIDDYLKTPKMSSFWNNFTFIHIKGNWSKAAGYNWCDGDGSLDNPYVLENITINASSSPTGSGIFIENSKNSYFIIRNCTVYNAKSGTHDAGIKLQNTYNGTLIKNNCSNNNYFGIYLYDNCYNNKISNNIANNNFDTGIELEMYCDDNIIYNNTANDSGDSGIMLYNECDNNNISNNIIDEGGIILITECDNNIIFKNIVKDTGGISLNGKCDCNTITNNTVNNINQYGIHLQNYCDDNIIANNSANKCDDTGIYLQTYCSNNTIENNIINFNVDFGIHLIECCSNNTIKNNIANDNEASGICLMDRCNNNTILENVANHNTNNGIDILSNCDINNISSNIVKDNIEYGIRINSNCDYNNISENYIYFNTEEAIIVESADCYGTVIKKNVLVSSDEKWIINSGINTIISQNYYLPVIPSLYVSIIEQFFSKKEFIITINISSGLGPEIKSMIQSIQIWWNGTVVPSTNINKLGIGVYNITLTPILVEPGQDPILLNMSITSKNHKDKYFKTYFAVDPETVNKGSKKSFIPPSSDDDGNAENPDGKIDPILIIIGVGSAIAVIGVALILIKKRK